MNNNQNDEDRCQYCNVIMSRDLLRDHIMCHEIENEEKNLQNNINLNPNLNQNQNNQNYRNSNYGRSRSQIQPDPPRYLNPNNNLDSNNNNNNNNGSINNQGNYNPINGENLNQNRNNNVNGISLLGNIVGSFTGLGNIGTDIMNITSSLSNIMSSVNGYQQNSNINRSRSINNIFWPFIVAPPVTNQRPNVVNIPPIVVGERGHVLNINRNRPNLNRLNNNNGNHNHNHINGDELNRIMELLPSSVLNEKKEGNNNECVICLEEYDRGESITTLPCLHLFHTDCIRSWLKSNNNCPVCKYEITLNSIMREH